MFTSPKEVNITAGIIAVIAVLLWACPSQAQEAGSVVADSVVQESAAARPHFTFTRVGMESSFYGFYVYDTSVVAGPGTLTLVAGVIDDLHAPEDAEYRELMGGAGLNIFRKWGYAAPFVTVAKATDAWYAEPSLVGEVAFGPESRLRFYGFGAIYIGLEEDGVFQSLVDPFEVRLQLNDVVSMGLAGSYFDTSVTPAEVGGGYVGQIALPDGRGSVTVHFLPVNFQNFTPDWRVTFQFLF